MLWNNSWKRCSQLLCVRQCGKYCEICAENSNIPATAASRSAKKRSHKEENSPCVWRCNSGERAELGAWYRQSGLTRKQEWQLLPNLSQRRALGTGVDFASGWQLIKTLGCILGWSSHQCSARLSPMPESHPYGCMEVLPHGHPVYQQKGEKSLEAAKLLTGIPAICNK